MDLSRRTTNHNNTNSIWIIGGMIHMRKNIKECMSVLKKRSNESRRKGYLGDWADYMFRFHVLELLIEIANNNSNTSRKRKPTAYNLFASEKMKEGMTMLEVSQAWQEHKRLKLGEDSK